MKKTIIKPRNFTPIHWNELVEYRELFWSLAYRDFRVRYAQTTMGLLWALIQPIISILILHVVFGKFAQVETAGLPHVLYISSGMICWTYFSYVLTNTGNSIIASQAMLKKIYFPRIIVPISKGIVGLIDLGIMILILSGLMIFFGVTPDARSIYTPVFILINLISALGLGIWISALTVRYRDFQYVVPFLVQLGLYLTPVAFPSEYALEHLPNWASFVYFLNPAVGIIDGFRWALFGLDTLTWQSMMSLGSGLVIFITGFIFFQRIENKIADIV